MDAKQKEIKKGQKSEQIMVDTVFEQQCNENWPICLYDFTFKLQDPEFFVYKVGYKPILFEDFFNFDSKESQLNSMSFDKSENSIIARTKSESFQTRVAGH